MTNLQYLPLYVRKYIQNNSLKQGIILHIHRYVHMYQHPIAKSQQAFAMEACRSIPCVGGDHQLTLSVSWILEGCRVFSSWLTDWLTGCLVVAWYVHASKIWNVWERWLICSTPPDARHWPPRLPCYVMIYYKKQDACMHMYCHIWFRSSLVKYQTGTQVYSKRLWVRVGGRTGDIMNIYSRKRKITNPV